MKKMETTEIMNPMSRIARFEFHIPNFVGLPAAGDRQTEDG